MMRLQLSRPSSRPIAIDLGFSATRLLQRGGPEGRHVIAADEIPVPDEYGEDQVRRLAHLADELPRVLKEGAFRGRKVILGMPACATTIQHMQLDTAESRAPELAIHTKLQGCEGEQMARWLDITEIHRNGKPQQEIICLALPRDLVMQHVDMLHGLKLEIMGVYTQPVMLAAAFNHLNRRATDTEQATLYVDLGYGGTTIAITHGKELVFARRIPVGGWHFDRSISRSLNCNIAAARAHRLAITAPESSQNQDDSKTKSANGQSGVAMLDAAIRQANSGAERRVGANPPGIAGTVDGEAAPAAAIDLSELLETLVDEISLCLRYHKGLFPQRSIARGIFVGGESRQSWLCRHIVQAIRLPGQAGDPLSRLHTEETATGLLGWTNRPRPEWSVAAGLLERSMARKVKA
ncbi:MAG: pilus assembly protein PilM [Planctomycetota bacterium]|nr:pilus assembly protein PilM [Planctomycetota bacterium]